MKIQFYGAALAAIALTLPGAASAQKLAGAVVAVVDTDRILNDCTACRTANTQLDQQVTQARQYAQQLEQPLQTEANALRTAMQGLNGKQPDAALQARIRAFETNQNNVNQQIAQRQQALQSTQAHITQQIGSRIAPIINSVMAARGASLVVAKNSTLGSSPSIDVTADVLAQLNRQLTTISVTPLPQQQAPASTNRQPQGR